MDRKEIGRQGALERWHPTIPRATHEGVIFIGEHSLECDVLPDGKRILRHKTFAKAMGRSKVKSKMLRGAESTNLPVFVQANNLTPYLGKEILEGGSPIFYKSKAVQHSTANAGY